MSAHSGQFRNREHESSCPRHEGTIDVAKAQVIPFRDRGRVVRSDGTRHTRQRHRSASASQRQCFERLYWPVCVSSCG
jgi:hypothetical protein